MAEDWLKDTKPQYDAVIIGSGLGGLTAANMLARDGWSVLLLEHHHKLGGLATWFPRKGGHIFDVSLHGFPYGMVKTCRKYWSREIADCIVQLKGVRFDNPQFSLTTTYDTEDFKRTMSEKFGVPTQTVDEFVDTIKNMNFYDEHTMTTRQMFQKYFPGRDDVVRFLMEPICYANGSTLDDEAITYGIVFSNFLSKGVYIFRGGTDKIIGMMQAELVKNGADIRTHCRAERIIVENRKVTGVVVNGKTIGTRTVVSNGNVKATVQKLVGEEQLSGLYRHQEGRNRRIRRGPALHLGGREARFTDASQPEHHQPDVLLLLSGHPAWIGHVRHRGIHQR